MANVLPTNPAERKNIPVMSGVLDYFPAALAEVARVSKAGNDQHNPGEPLHWARGKSTDQADTLVRHLMERGTLDTDGMRHSAKVAWRALALLQTELEEAGLAPLARGARLPEAEVEFPLPRKISSSGSSQIGGGLRPPWPQNDGSKRVVTEGVGMTKPRVEPNVGIGRPRG
jgi:hypothetical protein